MNSEAWDRRYADSGLIWTSAANRFLIAETEALKPGRALDLACGEGRNSIWLAERGWTVTGVDFSSVALEKAARFAESRKVEGEWIVHDLLDYSPPQREFDLVILFYLQLPAEQRGQVIRQAAQGVGPGGRLLVVAHDSSNLEHGYGGPPNPDVLYTAADVVADLDGSGLKIVKAERVERPVQTEAGERTALDALVLAQRE